MSKEKVSIKLLFFLFLFFAISVLILELLGESNEEILVGVLHALLFLPIEIYATVFFLNNLLEKREDLMEEARQDAYYFSIANQSQKQLILTIKKGLVENFLVNRINNIEKDFDFLYENRATILTENFWEKAVINKYNLVDDKVLENKKTSPLVAATEIGKYITEEITDFYSIYLKFIPLDIFTELHGIYQILEVSLLFSDNPYIMEQRYQLTNRHSTDKLTNDEYKELSKISQSIVEQVYLRIKVIENITDDHYKKMLIK